MMRSHIHITCPKYLYFSPVWWNPLLFSTVQRASGKPSALMAVGPSVLLLEEVATSPHMDSTLVYLLLWPMTLEVTTLRSLYAKTGLKIPSMPSAFIFIRSEMIHTSFIIGFESSIWLNCWKSMFIVSKVSSSVLGTVFVIIGVGV